jgi:hypothetical protein
MTSLLSGLFLSLLVPAPMVAEPSGAPPTLQFVKWTDRGLEQTVVVTKYVPVQKAVEVNVNGQVQLRTVTELVPVTETHKQLIDIKNAEIYDLDGKKVDEATWQKALSGGAVVAMSQDGRLPDSIYRQALKQGTLIVVVKPGPKLP